jgi:HK97 family phage portal protein
MQLFGKKIEFGSPAIVDEKSMSLGTSPALGSFLSLGGRAGGNASTASNCLSLYDSSSAVSIPINRIAGAIASMKIVIEFEDGEIITNHKVLDLLRKPSPYFTKNLFMQTLVTNYLITGEMPVVAIGGIGKPPVELQPISSADLSVVKGYEGTPSEMNISGDNMAGTYLPKRKGNEVRYFRDELSELHFTRNFSTKNSSSVRGQSLLVSASSEVRQHVLGGDHNVSLLEKGGRVSMIFHFEEDLSTDDFEETKSRVRSQYGGANNAGEIGVTAGGKLDIKEAGTNAKDMDFVNLQKMAKIAVANQFAYPLVLLDTDAATFNNYDAAKEALYDDAAIPFADIVLGGLSEFLLPRFGEDPRKMRITVDSDSIPALKMRKNKELKLRKEIGVESINELREALPNRAKVSGGEKVLVQANLIPIDSDYSFNENPSAFEDSD